MSRRQSGEDLRQTWHLVYDSTPDCNLATWVFLANQSYLQHNCTPCIVLSDNLNTRIVGLDAATEIIVGTKPTYKTDGLERSAKSSARYIWDMNVLHTFTGELAPLFSFTIFTCSWTIRSISKISSSKISLTSQLVTLVTCSNGR